MTIPMIVVHVLLMFAIAFVVWKRQSVLRKVFWPALGVKLAAGAGVGLIYTYYYSVADTFHYFSDGARLAALARTDVKAYVEAVVLNRGLDTLGLMYTEPRAVFLSRITSVFNLLTSDNYWITGGYYSFIGFLSAWFLVKTVHQLIPSATKPAIIAFLFLPSVVFWSSGLLKESLAIAGLYFAIAVFLKVWFRSPLPWWQWLVCALSLWVLWKLKYYYAGVFLPVTVAAFVYRRVVKGGFIVPEILTWTALLAFPVVLVTLFHPNFHLDRLLHVIAENNAVYNALSESTDVVHFFRLRADAFSFLLNAPVAIFSGLFRPLPWDVSAVIQLPPAVENMIVLILFAAGILQYKAYRESPHRILILAAVTYVVLLAALITFAAPNFGTLSRYRSGYFSLFVFVVLCENPLLTTVERWRQRLVTH